MKEDDEIRLYSHITEAGKNEQLLAKLNSQLSENGLLAFAIQGPHTNYRKKIKGGIFYEQKIEKEPSYMNKFYTFSKADGEVLSEQFCRFSFYNGQQTNKVLADAGFKNYQIVDDNFLVCYK